MKKTVLIVEDEAIIAWDMKQTLEQKGYSVAPVASSAQEAAEYTRRYQPDIILMDIKLKGKKNGIEAFRDISKAVSIPVIFITGNIGLLKEEEFADIQGYEVLSKPPLEEKLIELIEKFSKA
jgi:CheY-like chemotaxis protein